MPECGGGLLRDTGAGFREDESEEGKFSGGDEFRVDSQDYSLCACLISYLRREYTF